MKTISPKFTPQSGNSFKIFICRAFDVELLYIAQQLRIPVVEVPITWTEIDGSKITPVISWIQMGCDLAMIWIKYTIGAWKIKYETN